MRDTVVFLLLFQAEVSFYGLGLGQAPLAVLDAFVLRSHKMPVGDHDDPPVIVAWHLAELMAFYAAIAAVGIAAPFAFPPDLDGFRAAMLAHVAAQAGPPALVIDSAVVACSTVQAMQVTLAFGLLGQSAWAQAVSAQVPAALRGPIAKLYTPCPRATNGACVSVLNAPAGIFA